MNLESIRSITLSLLKKETDINQNENTAEYSKKLTAKFTFPSDFPRTEEMFETLLQDMYKELMLNAPEDCDSIGIWIEMDTITLDNALSLRTLDDIRMYSKEELNPAYEFFKMTLQ
jgi:hypothetical protein